MSLFKKPEPTALEKARDEALNELRQLDEGTDRYNEVLKNVSKLTKLIDLERGHDDKVSKDALAKIVGSAVLTLIIVGYESRSVITTKAPNLLNFLPMNKS